MQESSTCYSVAAIYLNMAAKPRIILSIVCIISWALKGNKVHSYIPSCACGIVKFMGSFARISQFGPGLTQAVMDRRSSPDSFSALPDGVRPFVTRSRVDGCGNVMRFRAPSTLPLSSYETIYVTFMSSRLSSPRGLNLTSHTLRRKKSVDMQTAWVITSFTEPAYANFFLLFIEQNPLTILIHLHFREVHTYTLVVL